MSPSEAPLRPPAPDGLVQLLQSPRSTFTVLWRATRNEAGLPLVASALADARWQPSDISAALQHHDCAPSGETADAIARDAAASRAAARAAEAEGTPAVVGVYLTDPPQVDIALGGTTIRIAMREILSRALLRQVCAERILTIPDLPKPNKYDEWLSAALASAPRIEAPPSASEAEHERWYIASVVASLGFAPSLAGTDTDRVYIDAEAGSAYLRLEPLLANRIRREYPTITARRASEVLRELGWEPAKLRDGDATARLWRASSAPFAERVAAWEAVDDTLQERSRRRVEARAEGRRDTSSQGGGQW